MILKIGAATLNLNIRTHYDGRCFCGGLQLAARFILSRRGGPGFCNAFKQSILIRSYFRSA